MKCITKPKIKTKPYNIRLKSRSSSPSQPNQLKLEKRPCDISMKLVPYGAGWTDVHLDICGDNLYFVISACGEQQFDELLASLYFLHPDCDTFTSFENINYLIDCKAGITERTPSGSEVVKVVDNDEVPDFCTFRDIPWKAHFEWYGETTHSTWVLQRIPDLSTDFTLTIDIEHTHEDGSEHISL